jgi:hypothetical protein
MGLRLISVNLRLISEWRVIEELFGKNQRKIPPATLLQMPNCAQCGEEFGSDGPAGLCPHCLIQPASAALLVGGLALIGIRWWRPGGNGASESRPQTRVNRQRTRRKSVSTLMGQESRPTN